MRQSAICLFVKNEADDIAEWVAHYSHIGADALLVYDDASTDATTEVLGRLSAHFPVEVFNWTTTEKARQHAAYRDCLHRFGEAFEWIGFLDVDEFLIPPPGARLPDLLRRHEAHDAFALNWLIFGNGGVKDASGRLVMETFTRRAVTQFDTNRHVKSFVRPKLVKRIRNAHYFEGPAKYTDVLGRPITWADPLGVVRPGRVVLGDWQLNHYVLRSQAHWRRRLARGTGNGTDNPTQDFFVQHDRNEVLDDAALPYAAQARLTLAQKGFAAPPVAGDGEDCEAQQPPRRRQRSRANMGDYHVWASRYADALRQRMATERESARAGSAAALGDRPQVSVILAARGPALRRLVATVESILGQTLADWELLLVVDEPTPAATALQCEAYASCDARIRWRQSAEGEGPAARVNLALAEAQGGWVLFCEPGDVFADVAFEVMARQAAASNALLAYADGDRVDGAGRHSEPQFRPKWNYRMMLAANYIGHVFWADAEMLRRVGGVRGDYPGAEDHDLLLRLSELISHDRICHVPDLLCHRRTDPLAEDGAPEAAPPTIDAGRRAIADHLARQGLAAQVRSVAGRTWYQVDWGFADEPSACVIIPYRERIDLTRECLQRVLATDYGALEVMLVDNGSTSEAAADFAREAVADPRVRVLRVEEPFNYSRLNNLAARQTGAAYLVLMNNDLHVRDGAWLRVLVNEALADRDVGVVGGKFLYPDGLVQHAGVVTGIGGVACHMNGGIGEHEPGYMGRALIAQELSVVTAACLLVERKLYWDVGGLDEERLKVAFNDVDLCLKAREQGRKVVWAPNFVATHYESASRGADDAPEKAERFHSEVVYMQQRWGSVLRDDPFYSRFFDLESDTAFHDLTDPYQLSDRQMPLPLRYPRRWIHG